MRLSLTGFLPLCYDTSARVDDKPRWTRARRAARVHRLLLHGDRYTLFRIQETTHVQCPQEASQEDAQAQA